MILTLDVGNTQIFGGVFKNGDIIYKFRKSSKHAITSDELGLFFREVLTTQGFDPKDIEDISICSVVPDVNRSLRNACIKYFDIDPFFLKAGVKTGLKIKYRNPLEVGADRIANSMGAVMLHPNVNLIVLDFGTANTIDVIDAEKNYLGGLIMPGLRLSMEALETKTAKLPTVEIVNPTELIGRSTTESIQSGLYYGNLEAAKGIIQKITDNYLKNKTIVIGTGGISTLFQGEKIFDHYLPDLVLVGLHHALELNREKGGRG